MLEQVGPSGNWHLGYPSASEGEEWSAGDLILKLQEHLKAPSAAIEVRRFKEIIVKIHGEIETSLKDVDAAVVLKLEDAMGLVYPRA